jgi:prepilin-type N-terminal cleavage/methylation domain-containing protein
MRRAFTLIEVMMSIAILGIFATLATPTVLPIIHRAELGAGAHSLLGFLQQARLEAMSQRRCVQVVPLNQPNDKRPQTIFLRALNTIDCEGSAGGFQTQNLDTATKITGTTQWVDLDKLIFDDNNVRVEFGTAGAAWPAHLTNAAFCTTELPTSGVLGVAPTPANCKDLRFRPTSRVWQPTYNATDPALNQNLTIRVIHNQSGEKLDIVMAPNGFILSGPKRGT